MNKKITYANGGIGGIGTAIGQHLAKDRRRRQRALTAPGQEAGRAEADIG